jgi:hypothetical protein
VLLACFFAPAGLSNPAAQPLDGNRRLHAIQRKQNKTDGWRQASNTSQEDLPILTGRDVQHTPFLRFDRRSCGVFFVPATRLLAGTHK